MKRMTSRERLMAIYRGDPPDRPALRLWAAAPGQALLHPAYQPVREAAASRSDLVLGGGAPMNLVWGAEPPATETVDRPTESTEWVDRVTTVHTPAGDLQSVHRVSTCRRPGYHMEYLIKTPEDLPKLLSVPYRPHPFDASSWFNGDRQVGERGIAVFGLPHAMYGLQDMLGSENFALFSIEARAAMIEIIAEYGRRILEHVQHALAAGVHGVFGWVGPELCIPPLMAPRDFDEFVMPFDTALCDAIHDGGGYVWVHCHGKMRPVLERFIRMGVDVLNPIEPPPMGDMTLTQGFALAGDRMGLEGGIENHDFWTREPDYVARITRDALETGRGGKRLIVGTCSGYMEDPDPPQRYIDNCLAYINEGWRYAESMKQPT